MKLLLAAAAAASAAAMDIPTLPEQFSCTITQYDDSVDPPVVTAYQQSIYDETNQRARTTWPVAGLPFQVPFGQIERWDKKLPLSFQLAGNPETGDLEWIDCEFMIVTGTLTDYFDFPADAVFNGTETINGTVTYKWLYTDLDDDYSINLMTPDDQATWYPVRVTQLTGKTWYSDYTDVEWREADESEFAPPDDIDCSFVPPSAVLFPESPKSMKCHM